VLKFPLDKGARVIVDNKGARGIRMVFIPQLFEMGFFGVQPS
jgi:hypothetical protein